MHTTGSSAFDDIVTAHREEDTRPRDERPTRVSQRRPAHDGRYVLDRALSRLHVTVH